MENISDEMEEASVKDDIEERKGDESGMRSMKNFLTESF